MRKCNLINSEGCFNCFYVKKLHIFFSICICPVWSFKVLHAQLCAFRSNVCLDCTDDILWSLWYINRPTIWINFTLSNVVLIPIILWICPFDVSCSKSRLKRKSVDIPVNFHNLNVFLLIGFVLYSLSIMYKLNIYYIYILE